jgi:serine phosphatase RsbU (regulator of sigma subunit)
MMASPTPNDAEAVRRDPPEQDREIAARGDELFHERFDLNLRRVDRLFAMLMGIQWAFAVVTALALSPYAWAGKTHSVHMHVYLAVLLGGAISSLPILLASLRPGRLSTRMVIAGAQMLWSALLIHLTGGRVETHFHVFGSLAFLAFYRDWRVLVPATLVIAADHLVRQLFWPESVYGIANPEWWRFLEHAFWVLFEDVFLVISCLSGVNEMRSIADQQARIENTRRLEKEMEIAARIQTSILPPARAIRGLEVAAAMRPAGEVGGDYYDVIPTEDGCWIGIGDVAGHGLPAGIIMLQAQSALEALVTQDPGATPGAVLCDLNRVMFENVRNRMKGREHMTLSLLRYHQDGRVVVAGAHEEIILCRASGECVSLPVSGTWIGGRPDITQVTEEQTYQLEKGDLMILYSDGLTEARGQTGDLFGPERVTNIVQQSREEPVARIRDRLFAAVSSWSEGGLADDVTVLIVRHVGPAVNQVRDDAA